MNIGEKIYELRTKANISQETMGLDLGVSRQAVSKWETNQSVPDLENLKMIANYFNVQLTDLIDENIDNIEIKTKEVNSINKLTKGSNIVLMVSVILSALLFLSFVLMVAFQIPLVKKLDLTNFKDPIFVFPVFEFITLLLLVTFIIVTSLITIKNKKTKNITFEIVMIILCAIFINLFLSSPSIYGVLFRKDFQNVELASAYSALKTLTSLIEPYIVSSTIVYVVGMSLSLALKYIKK